MRWAWLLVFAGCQFSVTLAPESEIPFCDPNEPMLVACYELDGTTRDGTANQLHASMTDVTFIGGMAGLAMQFGATSAADVADSPKFDVAALTIEAWIRAIDVAGDRTARRYPRHERSVRVLRPPKPVGSNARPAARIRSSSTRTSRPRPGLTSRAHTTA